MPKLTQGMGPYIKYPPDQKYEKKLGYEKKVMNQLIDQLPKVDYFFQNFHYRVTNWLPFYWRGYQQSTRYTYVLEDLSDLDKVFEGFDSSYKNKVRKAQKNIQIKKDMDIDRFYTINMMTFERQNIAPPYPLEFIRNHDKVLRENNAREIFYATDEMGQVHSALYLTWDGCSSYVHMVGEHPELRKSAAGILLVWEAIRFTKEELGLNRFDFEGSMIESVEQVRRSFGAKQIPYFQISKINSRLYKVRALVKELLK
jgi:lipid II:glycine glycyltransferase (peptidoglycan interpeptide bridge formation enzyme)